MVFWGWWLARSLDGIGFTSGGGKAEEAIRCRGGDGFSIGCGDTGRRAGGDPALFAIE